MQLHARGLKASGVFFVVAMTRIRWTRQARDKFLNRLRRTGNVSAAARAVKLSRSRAYEIRQRDPVFAAAWDDAEQEAVDLLEGEARRRAAEGVAQPLVSAGKLVRDDAGKVVTVLRYNDRLLEFLLRAHRPDKFKSDGEGAGRNGKASSGTMPPVQITIAAEPEPAAAPQAGKGAADDGD